MKKLILTLSLVSAVGITSLSAKADLLDEQKTSWSFSSYIPKWFSEKKNERPPVINPEPAIINPINEQPGWFSTIANGANYVGSGLWNGSKTVGSVAWNHKKKVAAGLLATGLLIAYGTNAYGFQEAVDLNVGPKLYNLSPRMHALAKTAANFVKNKMPYGVNMSTVRASANFPAPVTETYESYLVKIRAIQQNAAETDAASLVEAAKAKASAIQEPVKALAEELKNAAPKIKTDSIIEAAKKVTKEAAEKWAQDAKNLATAEEAIIKNYVEAAKKLTTEAAAKTATEAAAKTATEAAAKTAAEAARNNRGLIQAFLEDYVVEPTVHSFQNIGATLRNIHPFNGLGN